MYAWSKLIICDDIVGVDFTWAGFQKASTRSMGVGRVSPSRCTTVSVIWYKILPQETLNNVFSLAERDVVVRDGSVPLDRSTRIQSDSERKGDADSRSYSPHA
jgi:hypothetical protein